MAKTDETGRAPRSCCASWSGCASAAIAACVRGADGVHRRVGRGGGGDARRGPRRAGPRDGGGRRGAVISVGHRLSVLPARIVRASADEVAAAAAAALEDGIADAERAMHAAQLDRRSRQALRRCATLLSRGRRVSASGRSGPAVRHGVLPRRGPPAGSLDSPIDGRGQRPAVLRPEATREVAQPRRRSCTEIPALGVSRTAWAADPSPTRPCLVRSTRLEHPAGSPSTARTALAATAFAGPMPSRREEHAGHRGEDDVRDARVAQGPDAARAVSARSRSLGCARRRWRSSAGSCGW